MHRSEELEMQFSPSRWSKRHSAEEVVQKHVEFITKASFEAKKGIPCELGVPYGLTEFEKLDIFGTDLPDDSPIFIYVHGGYWHELSRDLSSYVVEPLNKHKFKVIVMGYTLCPYAALTDIVQQIGKAFLKCIEYAKKNGSRRLYICGHSAGAHLTASLFQSHFNLISAEELNVIKGVFFISGIYDLVPLINTYINEPLRLDNMTATELSPLYHHFKIHENITFFVIIGENDSPAFKQQSRQFYRKLKAVGNKTKLHIVKKADHFDIVERLNEVNYELIRVIVAVEEYEKVIENVYNVNIYAKENRKSMI